MAGSLFRRVRITLSFVGGVLYIGLLIGLVLSDTGSEMAITLVRLFGILLFIVVLILFLGWLFNNAIVERDSYRRYEYVIVLICGIVCLCGFIMITIPFPEITVWSGVGALAVGLGLFGLGAGWSSMEGDKQPIKWSSDEDE